jgi:hypothetical protein
LPIKLGKEPYGFIGKYQGLHRENIEDMILLANKIFRILWDKTEVKDKITHSLVLRFVEPENYDHANNLISYIDKIQTAAPNIVKLLENAPNENLQVRDAFKVRENLPAIIKSLKGKQMLYLDEKQVEIVTIDWLRSPGYDYCYGPEAAPGWILDLRSCYPVGNFRKRR